MKQVLTPFQTKTVEDVIRALTKKNGTERFLVADEVGLGKTIVARNIIRELALRAQRANKIFTVFYFANNLELLEQNRRSIKKAAEDSSNLVPDFFFDDRLGTYLSWHSKRNANLRVAVFTPGTSLPDRSKGAFATGKREERALAVALANLSSPRIISAKMRVALANSGGKAQETEQGRRAVENFENVVRNKRSYMLGLPEKDRRRILHAFWYALAEQLKVLPRVRTKTRRSVVAKLFEQTGARGIRYVLRCALCRAALQIENGRPDLVILDEFQRYPDVLDHKYGSLASLMLTESKVLLLSATPFASSTSAKGAPSLLALVAFLYRERGKDRIAELEDYLKRYRSLLSAGEDGPPVEEPARSEWARHVFGAKKCIENLLRPVMERTERGDDALVSIVKRPDILAAIDAGDLRVFDDFAARLRVASQRKRHHAAISCATPLWLSVPYPVQTLPAGYVATAALRIARRVHASKETPVLAKPPGRKAPGSLGEALAHPKLRALVKAVSSVGELALPWLPPSMPWWKLEGVWSSVGELATKSLLFSHFRAAPPAIGAIVSREVERNFGSRNVAWDDVPRKGRFSATGGRPSAELLAVFYPWQRLVDAFDPSGPSLRTIEEVLEDARRTTEQLAVAAGIKIKAKAASHISIPKLLVQLEKMAARTDTIESRPISEFAQLFSEEGVDIREVGNEEIDQIARYLLGAPGVVLARAIQRHYQIAESDRAALQELSWGPLRLYLGRRYFDRALLPDGGTRRSKPHHQRVSLLGAVVSGNLESVLDEQLFALRRIGGVRTDTASGALEELRTVLELPAGALSLHKMVKGKRAARGRLRAHAAVAFSGQESVHQGSKRSEFRPTTLRAAFNSPFWPHLLATTAVGQEGLDFHLWCRRVIHWDIPPDPLSLEQREGRVTRYASLGVRRGLAAEHSPQIWIRENAQGSASPWIRLGELVDRLYSSADPRTSKSGLAPWWVTAAGSHERILLSPAFSRERERFERLLYELDLYRLAMGQPNPEQFVARLDGRLAPDELRRFAVDLSSTRLRSQRRSAEDGRKGIYDPYASLKTHRTFAGQVNRGEH